ncbi:MFS transporter [Zhihengliuella halotolerans]|uniref:MFS transporter n=1 Tax=Zhihengliuella halotolerans TaxID=370736 RepID=UPI0015E0FFEE|nr:MFS transporter [Zhihengliuella halotolerans]
MSIPLILRDRKFACLLTLTGFVSAAEFLLEAVVYAWIVVITSGDPELRSLLLGVYVLISSAPRFIFGIVGGVFSDKFGASRVLLLSNVGRVLFVAVCLLVLGAAGARESVQVVSVFVVVCVCSSLTQFFLPARGTLIRQMVSEEQRATAASVSMALMTIVSIACAASGPWVFATTGLVAAMWIVLALFAAGTVLALVLRSVVRRWNISRVLPGDVQADVAAGRDSGFWRRLVDGWRACWGVPNLRLVLLGAVFYGIPLGVNNVALVRLFIDHGGLTIVDYGMISAAFGAGSFVGALLAPVASRRYSDSFLYSMSLAGLGATYAGISLYQSLIASSLLMLMAGLFFSSFVVLQSPMLLAAAPEGMTGRVISTVSSGTALVGFAASLVVSLLFAALASVGTYPFPIAVASGGVLTVLGGLFILRGARQVSEPHLPSNVSR